MKNLITGILVITFLSFLIFAQKGTPSCTTQTIVPTSNTTLTFTGVDPSTGMLMYTDSSMNTPVPDTIVYLSPGITFAKFLSGSYNQRTIQFQTVISK